MTIVLLFVEHGWFGYMVSGWLFFDSYWMVKAVALSYMIILT